MARARNIKPAFFSNEYLAELSFATRLLFIGLWTEADREGRLEDRPKRLKMSLFPADDVDVEPMIADLARLGFIRRYESDGIKVIEIINWKKHQNPHNTEKGSTLPAFNNSQDLKVNGELTVKQPLNNESGTVDKLLIPDSLIPDSLIPPNALAAARAEKSAQVSAKKHVDEFFEDDTFLKTIRTLRPELEPKAEEIKLTFLVFWRERQSIRDDWLEQWAKWLIAEK